MSIKSVMQSNYLTLCCPLLLLPSIFPSIRVFSNESVPPIKWPTYLSFSISPSSEYSGLIFFRLTGWISLQSKDSHESSPTPQFKSINSLALSLLYSPTLTSVYDLVTKPPQVVIIFLPRSQCLLISWLQSPSPVILEPKKIKCVIVSIVSPSICHEGMGPDIIIFVFWMLSFKWIFFTPLSALSRGSLVPLCFLL